MAAATLRGGGLRFGALLPAADNLGGSAMLQIVVVPSKARKTR